MAHHVPLPRPTFASTAEYGRCFTDAAYWWPYVQAVCSRHGMAPPVAVVAGLPGTFPVFIVDGRYVVKFYGDLFDGAAAFALESDVYALLAAAPDLPAPRLLASGHLFTEGADGDGWSWPYSIISVVPGISYGQADHVLTERDRMTSAGFLGPVLRQLHHLPLDAAPALDGSWHSFRHFVEAQHQQCAENNRRWQAMPERLIAQIDDYLLPPLALVPMGNGPHLLHCDLNGDHLLGQSVSGRWKPAGIIDFSDAMTGDRLYELVALHLGLFHCDKRLLRVFLEAYGWDHQMQWQFTCRAMSYTLLHRFAVLRPVLESPAGREVQTLDELASLLWDLDGPSMELS